ncbi:hypothetical protein [Acinetobacter sp.]|uniref:hypothetical protein n=1 Tax=Acinetobacter sp. TaxID=472 RepID=UPI00388D1B73
MYTNKVTSVSKPVRKPKYEQQAIVNELIMQEEEKRFLDDQEYLDFQNRHNIESLEDEKRRVEDEEARQNIYMFDGFDWDDQIIDQDDHMHDLYD